MPRASAVLWDQHGRQQEVQSNHAMDQAQQTSQAHQASSTFIRRHRRMQTIQALSTDPANHCTLIAHTPCATHAQLLCSVIPIATNFLRGREELCSCQDSLHIPELILLQHSPTFPRHLNKQARFYCFLDSSLTGPASKT